MLKTNFNLRIIWWLKHDREQIGFMTTALVVIFLIKTLSNCTELYDFFPLSGTARLSSSLFLPDSDNHKWNWLSTRLCNSFLCSLVSPASFTAFCQESICLFLCATARWYLLGRPPGTALVGPSISNGILKVKKLLMGRKSQTGESSLWSGPIQRGLSHKFLSAPK